MQKLKSFFKIQLALLLVLSLVLAGCSGSVQSGGAADGKPGGDRPVVYASVYYLYDLTQKLAGEDFEVRNLLPPGTEVHEWEPGPQDMLKLNEAAAFIYSGAGLESWVESLTAAIGKNVLPVDSSQGVPLLEAEGEHEKELGTAPDSAHETTTNAGAGKVPSATTESAHEADDHGHEHGAYDPHIWLNPLNVQIQLKNIAQALVELRPEQKNTIAARLAAEDKKLGELDTLFRERLAPYKGKSIIVGHEAFAYLCAAYGIKQIGIEGLLAASEPSPGRMAEIVKLARQEGIKVIFTEKLASSRVADSLARELGGQVAILDPYEGLSPEEEAAGEDYFSVMRSNLDSLLLSLEKE